MTGIAYYDLGIKALEGSAERRIQDTIERAIYAKAEFRKREGGPGPPMKCDFCGNKIEQEEKYFNITASRNKYINACVDCARYCISRTIFTDLAAEILSDERYRKEPAPTEPASQAESEEDIIEQERRKVDENG